MAINTWDGAVSTDYNDAGNWNTTGETDRVPTSADDVIIPDTSSINNCALSSTGGNPKNVKSLKIEANGTIVGGGIQIRVYGESAAGFAVDNDGIISGSLFLEIKSDSTVSCDFAGSSGRFDSVTVNHASCIVNVESTFHIDGNLTITLGKVICGGNTVEITGKTTLGPDSGAADQATLQCDASAMFLGSGKTDGLGLHVKQGGTFVGGSGNHTMGSLGVDNNAASKYTNTSATNTLDGHSNDSTRVIIGGALSTCTAAGTITITYAGGGYNLQNGNAAMINNLTFNSNVTANLSAATSITGNLTISQGTLTTTASNYALTVTGEVSITGTLTGNESAISMRNLVIAAAGTYSATNQTTTITGEDAAGNYAINMADGGTFTHNNGLVLIEESNNTVIRGMDGDDTSGTGANAFYRLQVDVGTASQCHLQPIDGTSINIVNNLTVSEGICRMNPSSTTLTVGGDVSIESGGQLGLADHNAAMTFKSLTIASGGTYIATSGTTTITGEAGTGYAIEFSGTYTHNSGTLKVTTDANTFLKPNDKVNHLIIEPATSTRVYEYVNNATIQGDLTINAGRLAHYSSTYSLDVNGDCTVNNTGILDGGSGSIELGSLTIASGGEYRATTGTTTLTGPYVDDHFLYQNSGTFTHNKGTVIFSYTSYANCKSGGDAFYNLISDVNHGAYVGIQITDALEVMNDFTINANDGYTCATATTTVHGNVYCYGDWSRYNTSSRTQTIKGTLTIGSSGWYRPSSGTNNLGGIRNLGGSVN